MPLAVPRSIAGSGSVSAANDEIVARHVPRFCFARTSDRNATFLKHVNPPCPLHIESGMAGYIHITRLSARTGTDGIPADIYQVNYSVSGVNYAVAWNELELTEFLRRKVPLDNVEFDNVMTRLHQTGHANIGEVDIPEAEATSMGMEMLPDDF